MKIYKGKLEILTGKYLTTPNNKQFYGWQDWYEFFRDNKTKSIKIFFKYKLWKEPFKKSDKYYFNYQPNKSTKKGIFNI